MKNGTFIEVEAYGDFDVKYTVCIMYNPLDLDVYEIKREFRKLKGLKSFSGIIGSMASLTDEFIAFLSLKGFTSVKTHKISFSD